MIDKRYFTNFPKLESTRLVYRQINSLVDSQLIYKLRTDNQVMKYLDNFHHKSIQESKEFIEKNLKCYLNLGCITWAIIDKDTNQSIGDFSFFNINEKHSRAEIGYSLLPGYWNKGIMTESLTTLINFGFNKFKINRLEADVNPLNINSILLLKKIGFIKEGYFKENYYFNGNYIDSEIYSLLGSNFNPITIGSTKK